MPSVTADELIAAANTLEKLSAHLEYSQPDRAMWTADEVRGEVMRVREETAQEFAVDALAGDIVNATISMYGYAPLPGFAPLVDAVKAILRGWIISRADDPFAN